MLIVFAFEFGAKAFAPAIHEPFLGRTIDAACDLGVGNRRTGVVLIFDFVSDFFVIHWDLGLARAILITTESRTDLREFCGSVHNIEAYGVRF
jgi:hypothetical protein